MRRIIFLMSFILFTTLSYGQNKVIMFEDLINDSISGINYSNNLIKHVEQSYLDSIYKGVVFDLKKTIDLKIGFNKDTLKLITKTINIRPNKIAFKIFSSYLDNYLQRNNYIFDLKSDTVFVLYIQQSGCDGVYIGPIHLKSKNIDIKCELGDDDIIPIRKGIYGESIYKIDDNILNILYRWDDELMKKKTIDYIPSSYNVGYYELCCFIIKDGKVIDRSVRIIPY